MNNQVRAKFRCNAVTSFANDRDLSALRQYTFTAIYDTSTPENQRFSKATPYGELKINVNNPEVTFEIGKNYYLDFTPEMVEVSA